MTQTISRSEIAASDMPVNLPAPAMPDLPFDPAGPDDRDAVTRYLFLPDRLIKADVAVVFGMTKWRHPLDKALALYRAGYAKRLLFTGGFNTKIGAVEADEMARIALAEGVPSRHITVDPEATNTHENVMHATEYLNGADSALLIAIHYHSRRVLVTANQAFPPGIQIGVATYRSVFYTDADWHRTDRGIRDVRSELTKLRQRHPQDFEALAIARIPTASEAVR